MEAESFKLCQYSPAGSEEWKKDGEEGGKQEREKINGFIHWYFRAVFILNCSLREGVSIIKEHCTVFDPLVVAV